VERERWHAPLDFHPERAGRERQAPLARVGVGFCNELFELERQWKKLPPSKRLEMRRQRAGPVIELLKRWKEEPLASSRVDEGSRLRKALSYLTNQWTALGKFLENGQVPIHDNESERQLRSLVVGRASWLFVGSDDTDLPVRNRDRHLAGPVLVTVERQPATSLHA
jgi:hypothetical protein